MAPCVSEQNLHSKHKGSGSDQFSSLVNWTPSILYADGRSLMGLFDVVSLHASCAKVHQERRLMSPECRGKAVTQRSLDNSVLRSMCLSGHRPDVCCQCFDASSLGHLAHSRARALSLGMSAQPSNGMPLEDYVINLTEPLPLGPEGVRHGVLSNGATYDLPSFGVAPFASCVACMHLDCVTTNIEPLKYENQYSSAGCSWRGSL